MNRKVQDERQDDETPPADAVQPSILPPDGIIDSAADIDPAMSRGTGKRDESRAGVQPDQDKR